MTRDELALLTMDEAQRQSISAQQPSLGALADQSTPSGIVPPITIPKNNPLPVVEHPDLISRMTERDPRIPLTDLQAQQRKIAFGTTGAPGEQRGFGAVDITPMGTIAQVGEAIEKQDPFSFAGAFNPMGGGAALGAAAKFAPAMFLGVGAKTVDRAALKEAKALEKAGVSMDEILDKTGFEKRKDKKWRFEISDRDTALNPVELAKTGYLGSSPGLPASKVFPYPELYKAYPELGNYGVTRIPAELEPQSIRGAFTPDTKQIAIREGLDPETARQVILHELQHPIQTIEGMGEGAATKMPEVVKRAERNKSEIIASLRDQREAIDLQRKDWIENKFGVGTEITSGRHKMWAKEHPDLAETRELLDRKATYQDSAAQYETYLRTLGEVDARNTVKRADLTPEQRFLLRPQTTEDIPREKQWVRRDDPRVGDLADQSNRVYDIAPGTPGEILKPSTRRYAPLGGEVNLGVDAPANPRIQTVRDPYRMMYPGIYGNPKEIAAEAASRVIPEDPAMKRLWGVSRGDLDEMARGRVGTEAPQGVIPSARGRGSTAAENIMIPKNEQRLIDTLIEGGRYPGLKHADAWYIFDPVFQRLEQMHGPEEAVKRFRHLNTMTGMASPGSDVLTELQRGTAAHWLERQGRFEDFMKYGGVAEGKRGADFPADMRYIGAHPYHSTSQALPMGKYIERGELRSENPKVPLYVHASGIPQTGFQTTAPVGDAHFSRGVGLADTRKGPTDVGASFSRPEYETMSPWWREKVAGKVGVEAVPGQARLWTVLGPQTGVESPLGQGKLELFSQQIVKAAHRLGISPEKARDLILSGGAGAGVLTLAAPKLGELADQSRYEQ